MNKTKQFFLEVLSKITEAVTVGDVLDTFDEWKDKTTDQLANWFAANKSSLDKYKKAIPKKFQPPIGKKAYRGSSIPRDIAIAILKSKVGKSPSIVSISGAGDGGSGGVEGSEKFIVIQNVPYTPHRKAQSWTLNRKVAADFSSPTSATARDVGVSKDNVGVVYEATIDNNFYMNPRAFTDYDASSVEREVLRIGGKDKYTLYMRIRDLPPNIALQFGGKASINRIINSIKSRIFAFLVQWTNDSTVNKKNEDVYLEHILIDKKSGKIQIQTINGNVMSVDDFLDRCEKRRVIKKVSWRDGKTPYSRALIKKTITAYEKELASLVDLKQGS